MKHRTEVSMKFDAPKQRAWALIADYGHPHRYVGNVVDAHITKGPPNGIGATRHCDLPRDMMMRQYIVEEITEWNEGSSFVYKVVESSAPISEANVHWQVLGDERVSEIRISSNTE